MTTDPAPERMAALRSEVRGRELIELTVDGVRARFHDQGGLLAAQHRAGAFYESAMLCRIAGLGREGVYVDVGANIGNHAVFFAQHCPSTAVHAFEPLDFVYAELLENIAANGLGDVVVPHRYGLGAEPGGVTARIGRKTYSFACRRLDEVDLPGPLAVVKVDIEGMELPFIRGAAETLRRDRPLVYVEAKTAAERAAVTEVLGGLGYRPTGARFNASPTYEFAPAGDPLLRRSLRSAGVRLLRRVRRRVAAAVPVAGRGSRPSTAG